MYNLLAVDDECVVLEMLRDALSWEELNINPIYTASNIEKAMEIIRQKTVDILLCDIEMPGGNGLELLQWVRDEGYSTITIFLTGYANFEYARRALTLGSMDYILKPVSFKALRTVIEKAVLLSDAHRKTSGQDSTRVSSLTAAAARKSFWKDILTIEHGGSRGFIRRTARNYGVDDSEDKFTLVCCFESSAGDGAGGDGFENETCLEGAEDIFGKVFRYALRLPDKPDGGTQLVIICDGNVSIAAVAQKCRVFVELLGFHYHINVACYVGEPCKIEGLYKQRMMLRFFVRENRMSGKESFGGSVWLLSHWRHKKNAYCPPDFNVWSLLLMQGEGDGVYRRAHEYMHMLEDAGSDSRWLRELFFHDFLQMIYTVLKQKGILANELFSSSEIIRMVENALRSQEDMDLNLWMLCRQASELMGADGVLDICAAVKRFVSEHIFDDISRDDAAAYVHTSPEHLSRIFKKNEGVTLVDYIQEKKIEAARELLESTGLPVGEIAARIGYKNFAYFSGLFKKYTGLTPLNYRKQRNSKS